jgi:hypothetical protein
MSQRVDELTLKLVDEPGSAAERNELARILDRSPTARSKHISLLEVEVTLRAGGRQPTVAPAVMEAIRRGARASRARRAGLQNVPPVVTPPVRRSFLAQLLHLGSRWRTWILWLLLVGSATAAAARWGNGSHLRRPSERHASHSAEVASRDPGLSTP